MLFHSNVYTKANVYREIYPKINLKLNKLFMSGITYFEK